jgi:S-adenosyl methyltransferase
VKTPAGEEGILVTDDSADASPAPGQPASDLARFDTGVAHPARVYDYWLGGTNNFAADQAAAEAVIAARPSIVRDIRANREFLHRAVAYLAAEAGIRQFLDIGMGIPASPNVHEIAQGIAPDARVVYVDNDPLVLAYAGTLLTSTPAGATAYVDADLRYGSTILRDATHTLDFSQPVAVILVGVLHLIRDDEDPCGIVARLMDAMPPGSYLVITHPASDIDAGAAAEGARRYNSSVATSQTRRSFVEVSPFFHGLTMIEPGVVQNHRWRPAPDADVSEYEVSAWAGIGRKP